MSTGCPIKIRYRFEEAPPPPKAGFGQLAAAVSQLVQTMPWAVPNLPFGATSRVSGGLLEALPGSSQASKMPQDNSQPIRLKAIESPEGILLEHSYDKDGRLLQTSYPDGIGARYRWDEAGRLTGVYLSDGKSINYNYGEHGWLKSMTWSGGAQFDYQYDGFGNLTKCTYPDRKSIAYLYDRLGRPSEISFGEYRFIYDWSGDGSLKRVLLQARGQLHEIVLSQDRLAAQMTAGPGTVTGEAQLASALGIWGYSSEGRLQEMWLPSGERLCLASGGSGMKGDGVWASGGQTDHQYDDLGVLGAILHPNGMRTVFHRMPKTTIVYAVSMDCAALYVYDGKGRLSKVRYDSGDYVILSYGRSGAVSKLTTAVGWIEFGHDKNGKMSRIRFSSGMSAGLFYGSQDHMERVSLRKLAPDAFGAALTLLREIWRWTVLKSALRAEDPLL